MSIVLPGAEGPLREQVFSLVDKTGRKGLEFEEIAERMEGVPAAEIETALRGLETRGRAVEVERRWYAAENTPWVVGFVELLETGDALLRPGLRAEPGHIIRNRSLKGALSGDLVLAKSLGRNARPGDWKLPEAHVLKILSTRAETLVGTLERDEQGRAWLVPYDSKMSIELEVRGADDIQPDHFVAVRVMRG